MEDLERLREGWLELVQKCKLDEAGSYYWDNLYPFVEKRFLENNKVHEEYDWLILPAGLESSYYILLIKSIKPKNVYFLGTKEFKENFLNKIIEKSDLKASQYVVDTLSYDEMDVADVYEKVRKRLDLFYNKKVILDLTRGKRIMSVGAGIVGAFFGFDLVYVDEDWIDEIKRGKPGTEKLVTVKNPFEVFGDLEGQEARELFNHHDYGAAIYFYKKLREKVADPRKIEIEELLAEAYLHWNSFNFKAAFNKLERTVKKSKQYNLRISSEIHRNLEVLEILTKEEKDDEFNLHVIVDLYVNALRKAEVGMFEDSVSRLYRVLELISQYRLREYGIETSNADLSKYADEYKKLTKELYGFEKEPSFEIGLKDGYILLFILKDYLVEEENLDDLRRMFGVIRVRDNSIIAHGLELAGEKAFKNMNQLAKKFIGKVCNKQDKNVDELIKKHSFIKLRL
jgi:CRISPR-associated protein (TIGR02710 family)